MFEAHVLHLLRKYLGEYVHGLSVEALRISVWKGDVVLKDLKLKAEALNSLKLPITVKAGFIGTITLKVPWKSLGKEPVIVLVDRVFILANPAPDGRSLKEEDRIKLFEAKLRQIEEAESATLEAISRSISGSTPAGNSWLGSLISTIIGNLKITISNVHVRYEDSVSNPGHPFACGITLAKLAAVTMDEQGNETFDTSGVLDKLRKSLQLDRLAVYHDSNRLPWKLNENWEDLAPNKWIEIFEDGINESRSCDTVLSKWAQDRNYLVSPINGVLKYHRLGNEERDDPDVAFENTSLTLSDVSLTITEAQYHDWIKLLEVISRYKTHIEVSHLRPVVPVSEKPNLWWCYAVQATLQLKKMCFRFSWDSIQHLCHLRRHYIQLYAGLLQHVSNVNLSEIRNIERDLDPKVILLWRFLAHAKVESVKSKEAAKQRMLKKSWFSFLWPCTSEEESVGHASEVSQLVEERFSNEEWKAINKLLSYQPEEEMTFQSGKGMQDMTQYLINVSIGQAAARIISINQTEILCARLEQLHFSTKFKHRSTYCDATLKFVGLSAPEGSLAQSVCSKQKINALAASFVYSPVGENIDWRLTATISPCHVTVFMDSYERFLEFMKRSSAVSPTIALETATRLQNKIEMVTRRAQEQLQMVLEEQSRFALDIDLDAPKVRVPIRNCVSSRCYSHLLLDLGHFTLHTEEDDHRGDQGPSLYSRFYISGRDIAAFFTDCSSDSQTCSLASSTSCSQANTSLMEENIDNLYSLIDRCGTAVIFDQIKVPHRSHPSMRISVEVPSLGIHFSPARYCRLMEFLNTLRHTVQSGAQPIESFQAEFAPWNPADLATDARILVWRGIGYSVASWQPCFLVLSGLYLYVLDSETSQDYQRCTSMAGKQVYEVPPTNVGGSSSCVAISCRGMDSQKALESLSTLIIEFRDEDEKATWLRGLLQATYRASAPLSVDVLGEPSDYVSQFADPQAHTMKKADLVVKGTVVETKLSLYGKAGDEGNLELQESPIIELLAVGGKFHVVCSQDDLIVKMKLHSLMIKDEIRCSLSSDPQYLACSVLNEDSVFAYSRSLDSNLKESLVATIEEEALFRDALSDFMSLPDSPEALFHEKELGKGKGKGFSGDVFYEAEGTDKSDFVAFTYLTTNPSSPYYDGIDTQVSICMSKLEFFCNRPTLVALINFGCNLTTGNSEGTSNDESSVNKDKMDDRGHTFVKGLLGFGKGRVVFNLKMNVNSVAVFLNKEDGSQLAMFVQESFVLDLKVHPSSISIEGTLGNFRLRDLSIGTDCCWGWLCDIRNQEAESLIKFTFNSYSAEEDDYEGYDYSLSGHVSAVRIVFLYRFVQEIIAYFMDLATPHTEEAIEFVDKVGGFEWLIQKYEIDGASAVKLDLSLDTPLIIVPRDSMSRDYIQLDLGHLRVRNEFSWHGCREKDPSAVHLDVLDAEILGINMAVGINDCLGKAMIREGQNIHVYVRRSLRDIFRKVPTLSLEVKVGLLLAIMSDKEYNVIRDCLCINFSEQPRLPPSFRGSKSASKDTIRLLADKVNMNGQVLLSRTVTILAVEVEYALLELCNGLDEESSLAHIALEGLWVSYRMTSLSEADLYITIPRFSILDVRPDTKPEMRLMLGSCSDVLKQVSTAPNSNLPNSTMFLMDCRWRLSSQSFVVRIQQPRVLVVPDFLLAVAEFFVPALGKLTGRDELMDPKNDTIGKNSSIVLCSPVYVQREDVVHLSPNKQLIADARGIDEYTYDGCGKTIHLSEVKVFKEMYSSRFRPIIIIGRGKRVRFVNVKIENSSLLKKYAYLSNDSSYSVSSEDGVELMFLANCSSKSDNKSPDDMEVLPCDSSANYVQSESSIMPSFSFEAQVVSAEFTFYDSSKSFLDDSLHCEKFLRAKMDFSFMYSSKGNDTWIRALLKDLTVEAGSGLLILYPVDISGGYTSAKDRTNISLISSDIYVHVSISVISLILNLQNQAAAALQFGNADPLSPCTNFERIWVSPRENGHLNNLTFWRPRAPSNYVTLGDCVTSRPIPPSQAVMAVSNTYGRVRKPQSFKLIGLFSKIQGLGVEDHSNIDGDCSLWLPIAPPGYLALGCVAHIGSEPPPNHIVYCIRSDLVTSSTFLQCMFNASSNASFTSGFSIWHLDNAVGSFYAHTSASCPPKYCCCDLNHLLHWNSTQYSSSLNESITDLVAEYEGAHQQASDQGASSSGWDILRSISKATNCCMSTPNFERIWWDRGNDIRRPVSIWRPIPRPGYAVLGDCVTEGLEPPSLSIIFKADNPEVSAKPVQFTKVAHIVRKGLDEVFFWYPIAPPGYASLGCLVSRIDEAPPLELFCCPRMDLVCQANIQEMPISISSSSRASHCWSIWKVENQAHTFLARSDLKKPSSRLAFNIGDSLKPKTRDNTTAEMKLRCFSFTVLDSFCGMMTPLFDATITNVKLATHGRMEELNAVLISSIAASTFNAQLEAWEPLVEPFDGIFKFETYDTNLLPTSRLGKRARVAATTTLNINLSAASLETLVETITSWRRQRELEEKVIKRDEEVGNYHGPKDDSTYSALDEDDFQTLIIENKLGCDVHLKKIEQNLPKIELLRHDGSAYVWIPSPRYSDRLTGADESREARHYAAVHIFEAKGLPIVDDGNSHNFFCALRLLVSNQDTNQQKLFPQSARTKCVRPSVSKNFTTGNAKWNELFIFEVPRKGAAKLEVEVTNLAARAGKGEVVGASSFPVGHGTNTLRKLASVRMLHQASDVPNIISYPLRRRGQLNDVDMHHHGILLVSTSYFEKKTIPEIQHDSKYGNDVDRDIGFWIALAQEGTWESVRSFLPLSVNTKTLGDDFVAIEVVMKNGKKHAIFRGLAMVVNDTDVKLDVMLTRVSMINNQNLSLQTASHNIEISPGSSAVLPWQCMSKDADYCLQVRPCGDRSALPCSWGYPVTVGPGFALGKDQSSSDQGSSFRQNPLKRGNKLPPSSFSLNQLEKKDVQFCCHRNSGEQFWLSVGTDASVLHTELNAPVYDWRISISSPFKLENRLPCHLKFTILEKLKDGNNIKRQQGIILSRGSVHIYSADVRNPIYLSLSVQGGWIMEKDPILVLDLHSNDHVSSFWIIQQQRKRRLRVSIERNMGGSIAAPKTIRLFVPYWITNDSSLSLAYQIVEIEPVGGSDTDSLLFSRAAKSSKAASKAHTVSAERKHIPRKNIQILEAIEDTSLAPSMLSPQDYVGRGGVLLFSSKNDTYLSPRVGIAVAIRNSENYSPGISLLELEKKQRVDVKAFSSHESYYKLSAVLHMTSDRTKVIHYQPHTLFINRLGCNLCLRQFDSNSLMWIHPSDAPKLFAWLSSKVELLELRLDGWQWSRPFSIGTEGVMCISVRNETGSDQMQLRIEVRSGAKSSHSEVIFRPNALTSPYRIENRSMFLPIRFRQADGASDSWQSLLPNSAVSFSWEDLGRPQLLELLVDGTDPLKSQKYNIDEIYDHQPVSTDGEVVRALRVTILKEEKINVIKISDWIPDTESLGIRDPSSLSQTSANHSLDLQSISAANCEFHVIVEVAELGLSVIDHTPEEILYFSMQNLLLSYSTGLGSGISRFKLRMCGIQVDNQLPLTLMPVLFRPQRIGEETDYMLKFSMTQQSNGSLDLCVYPYIGFQGPENCAFLINIHEPIIWRLHGMFQQAKLNRLLETENTAVSVDPIIQICVLHISEVRFKVSMAMSPTQRPVGVLGFWSSLMTALGNTENMPVRINQRFLENVKMRQSVLVSNAIANIKKDILGQPFQLLSGVDILGNASSAFGHMSKGVAALSMDKKFIQSRQRQENKGVEDIGDVIREGGGALAKGFFRGVTGILTKPLEGAKASGVEGFVQGVGKGIIGAAAQPVSGVLDLLSKTTEGANAMRMKIASAIASDDQLLRKRLPRVISGDNLLRPYDDYKAQGQITLQLAESGAFFGQVDLFKVRAKFALSDAYEDHFLLPKGKILLVTHRRVVLLQQPSTIIAQKKFNPARDPCSVLWDVLWADLMTMELVHGKKDHMSAPPSQLVLYVQSRSLDAKDQNRIIKCIRDSSQAVEVYNSVIQAMNTYGPTKSKAILKKKVTKPYSPISNVPSAEAILKDGVSMWSSQHMPASIPLNSTFGSSAN